ncbi:TonB-dependent siderophore receptor [Neisseria animalis]|uniref:TonB-dependent siderophore receptor n=1 Tax=Neisseria animalis TaxID=492 RepID=A0A5P3MPJ9_NEIAN|nr:TonB-dependent siderophore receptor [Neisseria animalis]QEY23456.1 TonB-dependent siderophore receptor [Neisseria animalis]ROW33301.1 TonB-dependent siderophore receptor [Neisseria animalis]VEE08979.1 iron-regulated outer membrane protein FetA [Neisseria animalis]
MKKTILAVVIGNAFALPVLAASEPQQNVTLDEVTVKADRQGTKVKTNLVTLREKDEKTATDLRGLLSEEPSIDIGGGNGTSQFLTIRGMGQNSVDIKVDNAYSDSQILYHQGRFIVDPSMLKTISVQKGAGSASAGIGQTNGAVIAKTVDATDLLKGTDKDWGVKLNAGYASNDGRSYGATVFGRAGEHADALFSFNRNDEDNYKPGKGYTNATGGKTLPYSALDKRDYLAKIGINAGDHRIVLSRMQNQHRGTRLVREEFAIAEPRLSLQRQAPAYRETTLTNNNIEWTANNLGFIDKLEANAYLMENKRYSADDSGCGYCGNIEGPTKTTITTKGANLNLDSYINDTLLKYGVNYRHQEIEPHAFLSRTHSLVNPTKADSGVYVEAIHDIGDFTLTGGLRYDHFNIKAHDGKSASGSKVNPSVGIIYQPTDTLSFSATHNYATRSPRLYDALMNHGRRGVVSIADGIKAERARNTEVGFNYDNGTFAVNGSYFWQKISDAIANPQQRHDANGNPIEGTREATNAGYIKNKGYELNASYRNGGLIARVGVAHSKPRIYDTHPDNLLSDNPEFAVQVGRTWTAELAYRFAKPNLELGWRNRTVEKAKGSVLVRNNNGGVDEVKRDSFNVNDIYANWKPTGKDNLNVNFSVNNVFNKFYYPHSQRAAVTTPPGTGRDFRLAVNYKF